MTLHVDFDRDLWVYVPSAWPWEDFDSLEQWSGRLVGALSDAYGYDASMRDWLTAAVEGMSRGADDDEHRFAYLSRPHETIGMASIYEFPARADTTLEELVGADDPRASRPVTPSPFLDGRLGAGLTATRHIIDDDGTLSVVAHWAWRADERDVLMIVGDFDLARFEVLRPDYDALARAIGTAD